MPWICPHCKEEMQTIMEQREVMKGLVGRYAIHFTCAKCNYHSKLEAPARLTGLDTGLRDDASRNCTPSINAG